MNRRLRISREPAVCTVRRGQQTTMPCCVTRMERRGKRRVGRWRTSGGNSGRHTSGQSRGQTRRGSCGTPSGDTSWNSGGGACGGARCAGHLNSVGTNTASVTFNRNPIRSTRSKRCRCYGSRPCGILNHNSTDRKLFVVFCARRLTAGATIVTVI